MPQDRDDAGDDGVPWDGSTWVDVGADDHWRPTFEERARALVILLVIVGGLFLAAAVASIDDGDGDDTVAAAASTTTASTEPTTTTTTAPAPESLAGESPPAGCEDDDRNGNAMRGREIATVLVLNGTPKGGHAGATTDDLEELGYSTMVPDNADIRDTTSVAYVEGFCAEADRLVDDLGIGSATFEPVPEEDDDVFLGRAKLLVTLGRDSL